MTRTPYPGGLFVHELVSGERVVLYPNRYIGTHQGTVPFPAGESYGLMFLHCTNVPEFKFSGLSHDAGSQMEWSQSQGWQRQVFITGRTVYDRHGRLRDTTPAGYQFIGDDGEPVSRLVAYETRNGLNEWTETGGLLIGQGHDSGGVCVWDGAHLRVLDIGECYFVIVDRKDDQFVISYLKSGEGAIVVRANRSDLLSLPILGTPIPTPDPEPQPMPNPVPDESAFVASFLRPRLKNLGNPDATRTHTFEAVNACCVALRSKGDLNWGLLEKTTGATVRSRASDILAYAISTTEAQLIDVVNSSEGADDGGPPTPSWGIVPVEKAGIRPISQWRQPYPLTPEPLPDPLPPDGPPSIDLGPILERLAQQDARMAALTVRLDALEQKPPPVVTLPTFRAVGETSRIWGHAHKVNLEVVPE